METEHKVKYREKQTEKEGNVTELFGGKNESSTEKKPKTTERTSGERWQEVRKAFEGEK